MVSVKQNTEKDTPKWSVKVALTTNVTGRQTHTLNVPWLTKPEIRPFIKEWANVESKGRPHKIELLQITRVKNPTTAQIVKCRKMLDSSGNQKPTISHYRDRENPITKYRAVVTNKKQRNRFQQWFTEASSKTQALADFKARLKAFDLNPSDWEINVFESKQSNPATNEAKKLVDRIKAKTHGLPEDQLTATEKGLIAKFPRFFEYDNGYIKVKKSGVKKSKTLTDNITTRLKIKGFPETQLNRLTAVEKSILLTIYTNGKTNINKSSLPEMLALASKNLIRIHGNSAFPIITKKANFTTADFKKFTSDKLRELAAMFQGEWRGVNTRVAMPDFAPKDIWGLGHLRLLKIKNNGKIYTINVDSDDAYVAGDIRCNLWFVGKGARITDIKLPPKGEYYKLGELVQVDYVTTKKHIESGKLIRFWHKLGEATRRYPTIAVDHDGFPFLIGGEYDVWDVGIVN